MCIAYYWFLFDNIRCRNKVVQNQCYINLDTDMIDNSYEQVGFQIHMNTISPSHKKVNYGDMRTYISFQLSIKIYIWWIVVEKKLVVILRETVGSKKGRMLYIFSPNASIKTKISRSHCASPQIKEEHVSEIVLKLSILVLIKIPTNEWAKPELKNCKDLIK